MNNKIEVNGELWAILVCAKDIQPGTEWYGNPHEPLQASRMRYNQGSEFKIHKHILNPRTIKTTQEAFIVISGKVEVGIYDDHCNMVGRLEAWAGEAILVYRGGHGVRILEDALLYEIKAGQYTTPSEDKTELHRPVYEQTR
jgi:hypothetical protein